MYASDDSFVLLGEDVVNSVPVSRSFEGENVYTSFSDSVPVETLADDVFSSQSSIYGEYSNGIGIDGAANGGSDGPILPPPLAMEPEEGFALREWRRQNAIVLEEKEKQEKELLNQIIDEAEQYKVEFYKRRETTCENNKTSNREKEKLFVASKEKFYAEAGKNYWKAIAELIPKEVPAIEKRRGKKDQEKKPSVAVIQGPKPGKPTDLARMRQIVLKLKLNTPPHLKVMSPTALEAASPENVAAAAPSEAVVAA